MPMTATGILPINGYHSRDVIFFHALQWLTRTESQESEKDEMGSSKIVFYKPDKTNISNRKVGQQQFGPCKVDELILKLDDHEDRSSSPSSFLSKKKKTPHLATIYEFFGCYCHGCPKCFPNRKTFIKKL